MASTNVPWWVVGAFAVALSSMLLFAHTLSGEKSGLWGPGQQPAAPIPASLYAHWDAPELRSDYDPAAFAAALGAAESEAAVARLQRGRRELESGVAELVEAVHSLTSAVKEHEAVDEEMRSTWWGAVGLMMGIVLALRIDDSQRRAIAKLVLRDFPVLVVKYLAAFYDNFF